MIRPTNLYEAMTNDKVNPTNVDRPQTPGFLERGTVISLDGQNRPRVLVNGNVVTCQQVTDDPAQYLDGVDVWITRAPSGPIVHGVVRGG